MIISKPLIEAGFKLSLNATASQTVNRTPVYEIKKGNVTILLSQTDFETGENLKEKQLYDVYTLEGNIRSRYIISNLDIIDNTSIELMIKDLLFQYELSKEKQG